ncbi:hypothetical protein [Methylobacterium sp. CM6257]
MAKLIVTGSGFRLWALTKAEDYLFIDAYLLIKPFVPNYDSRFREFERMYFSEGCMLADKSLMLINSILNRKGYDPLHLREGHSDSYTVLKGQPKAEERARIRTALEDMDDRDRSLVIESKAAEVNRQIDRDVIYDATKSARLMPLEPAGTVKVAPTALTEQLIGALDGGRLMLPAVARAGTHEPAGTLDPMRSKQSTTTGRRVLLDLRKREQETPPVVDTPPREKRARSATVKLAMLTAVQDEVSAIRDEMAALQAIRAENGALHAAVNEIERLKQVIAVSQEEMRGLRAALKAFQSSIAEVAIAA